TGLSSLYDSAELSDVCLIASRDEAASDEAEKAASSSSVRKFPAHRAVLAAATPYFRALFAPRANGAPLAAPGASVRLRAVAPEALEIVLRFVYTGEFEFSPDIAQEVYEAAALLQLDCLLDRLRVGMSTCIGAENCVPLYLLADAHGDSQLKEAAYTFMRAEPRQLADTGALDGAPDWLMDRLLSDECLRVQCETDALYTLVRWAAADPDARLIPARDKLRWHIRYNLISSDLSTSTSTSSSSTLALRMAASVNASLDCLLQPPQATSSITTTSAASSTPRLGNRSRLLYLGGRGGRSWRDDADLTAVDVMDAWSGEWKSMESLPSRRCLFAAASADTVSSQAVLIVGGESDGMLLDDCWLMDLRDAAGCRWLPGPSLPGPRAEHCLVRLGGCSTDGGAGGGSVLLLLGGLGQAHEPAVLCLEGPDFAEGAWRQVTTLPACRRGAAAVASPDNSAGGGSCVDFLGGLDAFDQPSRSWFRYDPLVNHWRRMPDLPAPLAHFGLVASPDTGALYCLGGGGAGASPSAACWRCDQRRGVWDQLAPMPAPRQRLCAAIAGAEIFVIGGECRPFLDLGHSVEPALLAAGVDIYDVRAARWRQMTAGGGACPTEPQPRTDACLLAVPYV
ncbi:hypothetical protein BOX15_Mlig020945g2, partial [Macrostomum lignano]